ncbi:hypothetical protein [Christiangramia echinicola]|uniref:hypothetical protein n=1 Tax=Christiangramia echinicola TaxID=279359 RepID=UPI000403151D|nr:hypothetical protein [Christiangramia echinicola]
MKKYIIISCLLVIGMLKAGGIFLEQPAISIPEEITAGEELVLEFINIDSKSRLLIDSSYGKTILSPETNTNSSVYHIPEFISNKAGIMKWKLINGTKFKSGTIRIIAAVAPEIIENYFGPRSIQAGDRDYSMLVSIPTDKFDNPLNDGTEVKISEFFQGTLKNDSVEMKNMFTWKNIFSKKKSGNIIVASAAKGLQSKEMISQVYPSLATDFKLKIQREHSYADGNQVTKVKTSTIRDEFENIISDGTSVEFLIRDSKNAIQKTYATTIDGVATAQLLHPETPEDWRISANITGMAKSDVVEVNYEPVIGDYEVQLNLQNKLITVGPLTSFLGQLIPDGAEVHLKVLDKNKEIHHEFSEPTKAGFAIFNLRTDINYTDSFTFKIETLGVTKSVQ